MVQHPPRCWNGRGAQPAARGTAASAAGNCADRRELHQMSPGDKSAAVPRRDTDLTHRTAPVSRDQGEHGNLWPERHCQGSGSAIRTDSHAAWSEVWLQHPPCHLSCRSRGSRGLSPTWVALTSPSDHAQRGAFPTEVCGTFSRV